MCLANHIKHSIKVMAKTNRKKRSPFDPPATFGEQTGAHDQKPNLISFIVWRITLPSHRIIQQNSIKN